MTSSEKFLDVVARGVRWLSAFILIGAAGACIYQYPTFAGGFALSCAIMWAWTRLPRAHPRGGPNDACWRKDVQ